MTVQLPGAQTFAGGLLPGHDPAVAPHAELFAVSQPYVRTATRRARFTITGLGFGADQGVGQVTLDGVPLPTTVSWSDTQITRRHVPAELQPAGPHQLRSRPPTARARSTG